MYRDNTLIPTEAIRPAALGTLEAGPRHYADLAREVRGFASRFAGPSLDILGSSLELLRYEGLVEPVDGAGMEDNALLALTEASGAPLEELLASNIRSPVDGISKLIVALKQRFLHLLAPAKRRVQIERLGEMSEGARARLMDLRAGLNGEAGHLGAWLDHEIAQIEGRIAWLEELAGRILGRPAGPPASPPLISKS